MQTNLKLKVSLSLALLASLCYSALATTWVLGGKGTQADAADTHGGGYNSSSSYADFQGTNGNAVVEVTSATYDHDGGTAGGDARVTASVGTTDYTGAIVYLQSTTGGWSGRVAVTAWDTGSGAYFDCTALTTGNDQTDVTANVGGALATISEALTNVDIASEDTIFICGDTSSATSYSFGADITLADTLSGSQYYSPATVKAVDKSDGSDMDFFDGHARPRIYPTGDYHIIQDGDNDYIHWQCLDFDAAGLAEYCIYGATDYGVGYVFDRCRFRRSTVIGFAPYGAGYLKYCEIDGHTDWGVRTSTANRTALKIEYCVIHDNGGGGVFGDQDTDVKNSIFYNNAETTSTDGGLHLSAYADGSEILDNLFYANGDEALEAGSQVSSIVFVRNSVVGHTTYGLNIDSAVGLTDFRYNHSHDNGQHTPTISSDADWIAEGWGDNFVGDPCYASVVDGSEDFTPSTGSVFLNNALPLYYPRAGVYNAMQTYAAYGPIDPCSTTTGSGGDWTATEKAQIRKRLGLDGTSASPTATPDMGTLPVNVKQWSDANVETPSVAGRPIVDSMRGHNGTGWQSFGSVNIADGRVASNAELFAGQDPCDWIADRTVATVTNRVTANADQVNGSAAAAQGLEAFADTVTPPVTMSDMNLLALEATLTAMKGATWNSSTDTLEAIRDRGDAAWTTATGFSTHTAADVWSVGTRALTDKLGFSLADGSLTGSTYDGSTASPLSPTRAGYLDNLNGHTPQTGDSYPLVSNVTYGLSALKTLIDTIGTVVDAIKVKTDSLTFTIANKLDTRVDYVGTHEVDDPNDFKATSISGLPTIGDGAVMVDHDYDVDGSGDSDQLAYTYNEIGINNAIVVAFLKTDWDAYNRSSDYVQGQTSTDVNGRWEKPLYLDPATYTIAFYRQDSYGVDTQEVTVTE